jgi:hypothetical protein
MRHNNFQKFSGVKLCGKLFGERACPRAHPSNQMVSGKWLNKPVLRVQLQIPEKQWP